MSHEHSYQHDLDNVIDASDAVLAIGTEKVDTTTLKDRSLTGNDATIHGAMPSNGYFMGGRRYNGINNYLDCGNDSSLNPGTNDYCCVALLKTADVSQYKMIVSGGGDFDYDPLYIEIVTGILRTGINNNGFSPAGGSSIADNKYHLCGISVDRDGNASFYIDGQLDGIVDISSQSSYDITGKTITISHSASNRSIDAIIAMSLVYNGGVILSQTEHTLLFNTLARLPLYSHNFTQYPNSDTSLTSIFPYTSGIITSGSFNKTDGLKCTSAGTIIFSNNFEFDGSEYLTLTIDGVEYSGTTTVTQGTITATIAQGSNDITIEMGTGDVLPKIGVQFREEV